MPVMLNKIKTLSSFLLSSRYSSTIGERPNTYWHEIDKRQGVRVRMFSVLWILYTRRAKSVFDGNIK